VLDDNEAGAPTIDAPELIQVTVALGSVDIITYLAPFKFELDAGNVIAKEAPVVPVKYVFVSVIVYDVKVFVDTISGEAFNSNKF
jgi:hypothetical protein